MSTLVRSIVAAIAVTTACTAPRPPTRAADPPTPVATIADQFITTFWCGPPLDAFDDERAAEIRAAGFNLVGASCEGPIKPRLNARALRVAARHGLAMLIKDGRTSVSKPLPENWQERTSKALAWYKDRKGLAGFFLVDEPLSERNPDIAAMRRRIRREAPGLIGYVNLLPDYVFLGPDDYREHVESYLFETRPDLLSFDHYPFLLDSDRPSYFANLEVIRELSIEYKVPFLAIVQLMPHAQYRDLTYEELSWQAFHALAFGARGISYFAYWTPSRVPDNIAFRFREGIIEAGMQTEHYASVSRLNPQLIAIARETQGFASTAVWDSADRFGERTIPEPFRWARGRITIGTFDKAGNRRAIVVNQDYREPATVAFGFADGVRAESFHTAEKNWRALPELATLPAGGALLLRFHRD